MAYPKLIARREGKPTFSFVIPTYNSVVWLPHAVESVLRQTYKNCEIVIVNDASTDSTPKYLKWLKLHHREVCVFNNDRNMGRCWSRNKGNSLATGDYIAVLDADDIAYPDRAVKSIEKLKNADFVYGSADIMGPMGNKEGYIPADVFNRSKALDTLQNRIVHSTCAYTKKVAAQMYSNDKEISDLGIDDWEFEIRLLMKGFKFDYITHTIGAYRINSLGISQTRDENIVKEKKQKVISEMLSVA